MESMDKRAPGRPSTAAPFVQFVVGTLIAEPGIDSADLLRRARLSGYAAGKSAFYNLVAKLREQYGVPPAVEQRAVRAQQRRDERAAEIARLATEANERREREARQREDRLAAKARAKEDRARERAGLAALRAAQADAGDPTRLRAIGRAWLASRTNTHKDGSNERSRWRRHLEPAFGDLLPGELDANRIRVFVEEKLATGLSSTSVGRCVGLLSSLFTELVEKGVAPRNPVETVPRAVRRMYRNAHDPKTTPFLETQEDIRRLRAELSGTLRDLFSVGVLTGLRPGELRPLEWADVKEPLRRIYVMRRLREGKIGTPKSGKGRPVPLAPLALEVLRELRSSAGDSPLVFPPGSRKRYVDLADFREEWRAALARAGLPQMRFYDATRHTFASQWVLAGLSIEKLSRILGHSTFGITERYAHLKPEALSVPDVISFGDNSGNKPDGEP